MRTIPFTKMHGLGNDFVVINAYHHPVPLSPEEILYMSDRHQGIGFDQLLLVEPPSTPAAQFKYRIFNADSSEVEQCGNGARCFARYVFDQGLTTDRSFPVETARGIITPYLEDNGQVTVDMGIPNFAPVSLPLTLQPDLNGKYSLPLKADLVDLGLEDVTLSFEAVSMGNPHAVISVPSVDLAPVEKLGAWLETHPVFPNRVNVEFVETINENTLKLRVFERGTGETLACGTGSCASAAAGLKSGRLKGPVTVHMRGGTLVIKWDGGTHPLFMTGPAVTVFHGECLIPSFN